MSTAGTNPSLKVIGYCHAGPEEIWSLIRSGQARRTVDSGEFVIVAQSGEDVWLITSRRGAVTYFYRSGAQFRHGRNLAEVTLPSDTWVWNPRAVADLFALEHLTGNDSLLADVFRTPPGSILHWNGRILEREDCPLEPPSAEPRRYDVSHRLIDLLVEEVGRSAGPEPVVSMSAGFDSRLLLAALLHLGYRPRLVTMGRDRATDRIVAQSIASRFDLKIDAVEPEAVDYLRSADLICAASSGTTPAEHWHTYIYTAKAGLSPQEHFLIGSNGEYVRTFYFDKGLLSLLADWGPPALLARQFWALKSKHPFTDDELRNFAPEVADAMRAYRRPVAGSRRRRGSSFLRRLDRFYLEHRIRHFIGNGLLLYGLTANWRTPFLSTAWIGEADKLDRRSMLGSNWHRQAIARLCPTLLDFPEPHAGARMSERHGPFYWRKSHRSAPFENYVDYAVLFRDKRMLELLADNAGSLENLVEPRFVRQVVDEHARHDNRRRTVSILLGLAVWRTGLRARDRTT